MTRRGRAAILLAAAGVVLLPPAISAHAFGRMYVLPLPLGLYLYGAAAAVIASFIVVVFFTGPAGASLAYPRYDITERRPVRVLRHVVRSPTIRVASMAMFVVLLVAGVIGPASPTLNFASVFVWIVFYLGFAYLSALIGHFWSDVNPFRLFAGGWGEKPLIRYPAWLGYIPAVLFLYGFFALELLTGGAGADPRNTAREIGGYYAAGLAGSLLIGQAVWFQYAEFLGVFFRLLSRIAIVECRDDRVYLRAPFVGLLGESIQHLSLVFFILLMLSSTALDGLRETVVWSRLYGLFTAHFGLFGDLSWPVFSTLALVLSPVVYFGFYLAAVAVMKGLVTTTLSIPTLIKRFAPSLVPIALAYHVAHYFTLLVIEGQSILALVSDPFGRGWNLFHTAHWQPNVGILSAAAVWNIQVAAILIGHIASVYLAHRIALSLFRTPRQAVASQVPMLALMVWYTVAGLWILSRPMIAG